MPVEFADALLAIGPASLKFQAVLKERFEGQKQRSKFLREWQLKFFGGSRRFINSEKEFLTAVIEPAMNPSEPDIQQIICEFLAELGSELSQRWNHAGFKDAIRDGFLNYLETPPAERFVRYWTTTTFVLSHLFYFLAPQYRIRNSTCAGEKIIEHERNNLADQRYVASALMCSRLLTADENMAKVLKIFEGSVWWRNGKVFHLDRGIPLTRQIEAITNC